MDKATVGQIFLKYFNIPWCSVPTTTYYLCYFHFITPPINQYFKHRINATALNANFVNYMCVHACVWLEYSYSILWRGVWVSKYSGVIRGGQSNISRLIQNSTVLLTKPTANILRNHENPCGDRHKSNSVLQAKRRKPIIWYGRRSEKERNALRTCDVLHDNGCQGMKKLKSLRIVVLDLYRIYQNVFLADEKVLIQLFSSSFTSESW